MFGLAWVQNTAHAHFVGIPDLPGVHLDSGKLLKLSKTNFKNRNRQIKKQRNKSTNQTNRQTDRWMDGWTDGSIDGWMDG